MTRVLYWNIENFSRNKLQLAGAGAADARDRFDHIINIVRAAAPDVFVIVEVFDRTREVGMQGRCINDNANCAIAVQLMLAQLRARVPGNWFLVPPLKVGNYGFRESVAVFFNGNTLDFAGPNVYCRPNAGVLTQSRPPAASPFAGLRDYPAAWARLPIRGGVAWNALMADGLRAVPENQGAARWEFYTALGARINFPGVDNRSPYLVHFRESGGARRLLKIFAVHTSPSTARNAVLALADIQELAVGGGEASLVIGDFNIDSFDMTRNGCYIPLLNLGYEWMFDPRDATIAINPARKPYCMTHLLPTAEATPYNMAGGIGPDPQHDVNPRLGYMGSRNARGQLTNSGAIDNAFVLYGGGAAPVGGARAAIVNTVIGKPYTDVPPPPGVTAELTGGPAFAQEIATPGTFGIGVRTAIPGIGALARTFQTWPEFGHIRSTSDHLPIVADI